MHIVQINTWLSLASQAAIDGIDISRALGKALVISVNENNEKQLPKYDSFGAYLWCPFNDPGENLTSLKLATILALARIWKDNGGIVVHCYGGSNRSSLICAFLMVELESMSPLAACKKVKEANHAMGIRSELSEKFEAIRGYYLGNVEGWPE